MSSVLAVAVAAAFVLVGCPSSPAGDLDPDVLPVTDGDWYQPGVAATWQWQLLGAVNSEYDVDAYDVDLFDVSATQIAALQADGRSVICYFSAGSYEDFRSDSTSFESSDQGRVLQGFDGEWWLDVRSANVQDIMLARLDMATDKGCDGVEPDNVDGYTNPTGFDLTATDQLAFNRFLANAARTRGLAVALKNDLDQIGDLVDYFDMAVNEQCHEFDECSLLADFVDAGKPVWNAEYPGSESDATGEADTICPASLSANLRTLLLPLDLDDSFRVTCD